MELEFISLQRIIIHQVEIKTGSILGGKLPPKARALTEEWRLLNLESLLENWQLMVDSKKLKPIAGLN